MRKNRNSIEFTALQRELAWYSELHGDEYVRRIDSVEAGQMIKLEEEEKVHATMRVQK